MQSVIESVRIAFGGLASNRLRAILTTLGIAIGVAAVIILVSLGQAVQVFVEEQFLGIGTNLLFVAPSSSTSMMGGGPQGGNPMAAAMMGSSSSITQSDVDALSDPFRVPDAAYVVPELRLSRGVAFEGVELAGMIYGTSHEYLAVRNRSVAAGRFFDERDMDSQSRVAVLGLTTAEDLFPPEVFPVGQTIRIDEVPFQVIGILTPYGGTSFGDEDDVVLVPLTTAQIRLQNVRTLAGDRPLSRLYIQAASDENIDDLVEDITTTLREEHDITFRDDDDFIVLTQSDLLNSFGAITSLLTIFLGVIAGISLLVGGIGIMNIMLVTVTERTREIGLRKAVGAQPRDILTQFLVESLVLATVGGLFGIGVAYIGTYAIGQILPDLSSSVRLGSVLLATTISAMIGVGFGLYPAQRAAKLHPIDALRFE